MTIKPREEADFPYINGDYSYRTEDGRWHLIRDGVDLLKGKKATECFSYPNGYYEYKTEDGKRICVKGEGNE